MKPKIAVDDVERARWAAKTEITERSMRTYMQIREFFGWSYEDRTAWARHKDKPVPQRLFDDE